ncbi:hypothetical protein PSEUDO8O_10054 [Pseudomonas sp. 8O]|nr:hypothetical protein PSEUDO8O_10054 [Pseudomonas sp. 8O]
MRATLRFSRNQLQELAAEAPPTQSGTVYRPTQPPRRSGFSRDQYSKSSPLRLHGSRR